MQQSLPLPPVPPTLIDSSDVTHDEVVKRIGAHRRGPQGRLSFFSPSAKSTPKPSRTITLHADPEFMKQERERRKKELVKYREMQAQEELDLLDPGAKAQEGWVDEIEAEVEAELPSPPTPPPKDTQIRLQVINFMLFGAYDPSDQLMAMNEPGVFFDRDDMGSIMKKICQRHEFIQLVQEYVEYVGNNWGVDYSMIKEFYKKIQGKIKKITEKRKKEKEKRRKQIKTIIKIIKKNIQNIEKDIKAANKKSQYDVESHDELDSSSEEETEAAKLLGEDSVLNRMRAKDQIKRKQDKAVQEQLNIKKKEKEEQQKKVDEQKKQLEANKFLSKKEEEQKAQENLKEVNEITAEKREAENENEHKQRMLDALKTPPQLPFAATALGHIVTYGIMFGKEARKTIEALNKIPGLKDIPIPQLVTTAPDGSGPPRGPGSGKMTMDDDSGAGASASDSAVPWEPTPQFVTTAPDGSDPPPSPPPSPLPSVDPNEEVLDFDPDDWDDSMLLDDIPPPPPPAAVEEPRIRKRDAPQVRDFREKGMSEEEIIKKLPKGLFKGEIFDPRGYMGGGK